MAQQTVVDSQSPLPAHASSTAGSVANRRDAGLGLLLFLISFALFWLAPMRQVTDSEYSLLLSQSLIEHQTFRLDNYAIPRQEPVKNEYYVANGSAYQIELVDGHLYYFFPVGGSILSIPFVKVMNLFGLSVVRPDGTYDYGTELWMQGIIAPLLMAAFVMVLFLTARYLLTTFWSVIVALGMSFGSQVLSTASRGVWSDTWALLLLAITLLLLVRAEVRVKPFNAVLLGTLLAWAYICRPTNSISAFAIAVYVLLYYRTRFVALAATAAFWLACFIAFSYYNFHKALPSYYYNRLRFSSFFDALAGNLINPSRGLFVCVPITVFILFLSIRYWRLMPHKRLAVLSLLVIFASVALLAGFVHWWGGHCFGARLTTGVIPWFAVLAVLSIKVFVGARALNGARVVSAGWALTALMGTLLLSGSLFINVRGATSQSTWAWNAWVDEANPGARSRLWNWRSPQFLAGLVRRPMPETLPLLRANETVDLTKTESNKYLLDGWSNPEPEFHWTDGSEATIMFTTDPNQQLTVKMEVQPFLAPPQITSQKVTISLNDEKVAELVLTDFDRRLYEIPLPKPLLSDRNVIALEPSNYASPHSLGLSIDRRELGVSVRSFTLAANSAGGQ